MPATVSACLIVRNEEAALPTCLKSVAGLVSEVVVVDTGSTDHTKEIAASCGARVFDFPWRDDFSAARNESLRHARGDWVLWLDADEFLDEANRERLRALLAALTDEDAAYVLTQRSASPAGPAMRVRQVRLFRRRPAVRWEYRVHEQLLPSLRRAGFALRPADVTIEHRGYEDPAAGPRKVERNLRLLLLDREERPEDPFTLFNLGGAYLSQGRPAEALPLLQRSLGLSQPGDSITPKLYAALASAHERLGRPDLALAALRQGRVRCPDDAGLLLQEGQLRRAAGDLAGAAACWEALAAGGPAGVGLFADGDEGLPDAARHQLALLRRDQGRPAEAEEVWKELLARRPGFLPGWVGLGDLLLAGQRWQEVEEAAARLEGEPGGVVEALVLRGRACLARRDFQQAQDLLHRAVAAAPQAVAPRLYLTHVLLQEDRDPAAADRALRALLALDPAQAGAWRNLAVLLRHRGKLAEAVTACQAGRAACPAEPELWLLHGLLLAEAGDLAGAEASLTGLLEREAAAPGGGPDRERRLTARHNLALVCRRQGRLAEAERHWRAALAEAPEAAACWLGLGELLVQQGRLPEVEAALGRLGEEAGAALLKARLLWRRGDHAAARRVLEAEVAREPAAVEPLRLLTYVLLDESRDPAGAEAALRRLLKLAPADAEARHNLRVLRQRLGGPVPA